MNNKESKRVREILDWKEELRKCKEDEAYFFENYCLIDGKKLGKYTVERFKKYLEDNKVVRKLYRTRIRNKNKI